MILVVFVRNVGGHVSVGIPAIERLKEMKKGSRQKMGRRKQMESSGGGGRAFEMKSFYINLKVNFADRIVF